MAGITGLLLAGATTAHRLKTPSTKVWASAGSILTVPDRLRSAVARHRRLPRSILLLLHSCTHASVAVCILILIGLNIR